MNLDHALAWLSAHPGFWPVAWPIFTAIVTMVFSAKSPDDLARMPAWRRRAVAFIAASGIDLPALLDAIKPKSKPRGFTRARDLPTVAAYFVFVFGLAAFTASCKEWLKPARTFLDVARIACIVANAESDDATVQRICGVVDELAPAMREVLAAQRTASRRYASERLGACMGPDAGDAGSDGGVP